MSKTIRQTHSSQATWCQCTPRLKVRYIHLGVWVCNVAYEITAYATRCRNIWTIKSFMIFCLPVAHDAKHATSCWKVIIDTLNTWRAGAHITGCVFSLLHQMFGTISTVSCSQSIRSSWMASTLWAARYLMKITTEESMLSRPWHRKSVTHIKIIQ